MAQQSGFHAQMASRDVRFGGQIDSLGRGFEPHPPYQERPASPGRCRARPGSAVAVQQLPGSTSLTIIPVLLE